MRPIIACSICLRAAVGCLQAQNHPPVVSNVHAEQRPGTTLVDITYDVADAEGDTLTITVQVAGDSGKTAFTVPVLTLRGAVGMGVRPGTGKTITWDAGQDAPDRFGWDYRLKILAFDAPTINDGHGDYVLVPAGEFRMGDNFKEGYSDERPVHTVLLDAYYIGKYEVINREFRRFIEDRGYQTAAWWAAGGFQQYGSEPYYWTSPPYRGGAYAENALYPVVGVTWYEAMAYGAWLSAKTGKTYRLPTEAEWEKAARGTDQRRFPWGGQAARYQEDINGGYANYTGSWDPFEAGLTPVGFYDGTTYRGWLVRFQTQDNASPYGAYDMAGNVWEWCADPYVADYYAASPGRDPTGPTSGGPWATRVIRGGGWVDMSNSLRAARRRSEYVYNAASTIGFRCVREP